MYWLIIWRNFCFKPIQGLITVAVVGCSIALSILVLLLSSSIQQGLIKATEPFDLIVGAKGSPNQLVLNTVFLQDVPIGNIDYKVVGELKNNPYVESAVPIGYGDNYRGYCLVGTEVSLFSHKIKPREPEWLQLATGRQFSKPFEAVIGAKVAKETGLRIGDQFSSSHGVVASGVQHEHKEMFTVVGVLKEIQGPYDRAILVSLESIWHMHAKHKENIVANEELGSPQENSQQTTVILVKPKGYAEAMMLYQQFQNNSRAQLVFPAQVVVKLFAILGEGENVMKVICFAVLGMSLLVIMFSLSWSTLAHVQDRAILRALGASHRNIFLLVIGESVVILFISLFIGACCGHLVFEFIANIIQKQTSLAILGQFSLEEGIIIVGFFILGIVASIFPALRTMKCEIVNDL